MAVETRFNLTEQTISQLQDLIQLNIDSHEGFLKAADKIENLSVSSMFRDLAQQRQNQASELQELVALNSESPQRAGSFTAAVHRTWIDIRSALGGGLLAVMQEAERGEDSIKNEYEKALTECGGSPVVDVLNRHYLAVKAAHDRVRDMRDSLQQD